MKLLRHKQKVIRLSLPVETYNTLAKLAEHVYPDDERRVVRMAEDAFYFGLGRLYEGLDKTSVDMLP